jgi:hypothetical protein
MKTPKSIKLKGQRKAPLNLLGKRGRRHHQWIIRKMRKAGMI